MFSLYVCFCITCSCLNTLVLQQFFACRVKSLRNRYRLTYQTLYWVSVDKTVNRRWRQWVERSRLWTHLIHSSSLPPAAAPRLYFTFTMEKMKINFAPVDLPIRRRLQTAMVLQWVYSFLGLGECACLCLCPFEMMESWEELYIGKDEIYLSLLLFTADVKTCRGKVILCKYKRQNFWQVAWTVVWPEEGAKQDCSPSLGRQGQEVDWPSGCWLAPCMTAPSISVWMRGWDVTL